MPIQLDSTEKNGTAVTCDVIKFGPYRAPQKRIRRGVVPGQAGETIHDLGEGNSSFLILAGKYGAKSALNTWEAAVLALVGAGLPITITNGTQTRANLRIDAAGNVETENAHNHNGTDELYRTMTGRGTVEST